MYTHRTVVFQGMIEQSPVFQGICLLFFKRFRQEEKTLSAAADEGCTNNTDLQADAYILREFDLSILFTSAEISFTIVIG